MMIEVAGVDFVFGRRPVKEMICKRHEVMTVDTKPARQRHQIRGAGPNQVLGFLFCQEEMFLNDWQSLVLAYR
jgi:hypothetical protein